MMLESFRVHLYVVPDELICPGQSARVARIVLAVVVGSETPTGSATCIIEYVDDIATNAIQLVSRLDLVPPK